MFYAGDCPAFTEYEGTCTITQIGSTSDRGQPTKFSFTTTDPQGHTSGGVIEVNGDLLTPAQCQAQLTVGESWPCSHGVSPIGAPCTPEQYVIPGLVSTAGCAWQPTY
jgi:hypothetical protein